MNRAIITGQLGADIETFETSKGLAARFSVATSEGWKDGDEWRERTDWHSVKTFIPGIAEMLQRNGKKGRRIEIIGKLRTDKYTDKEGVERWSTEIIIDRDGMVEFPEPKREDRAAAYTNRPNC
jgi:single-strand DNA-binding protein